MEPLVAVYDACVLCSNFLRDFLVRRAIHGRRQGILRAKWTGRIHREWIRAVLRRFPLLRANLRRTRQLMDQHVRGCRVRGYERWERRFTLPDEDDRHVLAAALACVADVIVTFNVADFPAETLAPFGVVAVAETSQAVAQSFLSKEEDKMASLVNEHRAGHRRTKLAVNTGLRWVARRQAQRMVMAGYTYHNADLPKEADKAIPGWLELAENVGVGGNPTSVFKAFLSSNGHHKNIDTKSFNVIGVAAMAKDSGDMFFTQNFALYHAKKQSSTKQQPGPKKSPPKILSIAARSPSGSFETRCMMRHSPKSSDSRARGQTLEWTSHRS